VRKGIWPSGLGIMAAPIVLVFALTGCGGGSGSSSNLSPEQLVEANLGAQVAHIGGATNAVARFTDTGGTTWGFYNMANRLAATPVRSTKGAVHEIRLPAAIQDIKVIEVGGVDYALVAIGHAGIAVVDITNPSTMTLMDTVTVNYYQDGITYAEGGGDLVTDQVIESDSGFVAALETDGTTLWIADRDYGIHKTALSNLLAATPVTETDGTLKIDAEIYTLQYSGENPWGGPVDLQLHDGLLYAALGFLGVGVYNPHTLAREGQYNLYTDTSVTEDWFVDMDVANEVQPGNLDPDTGMPNYDQASFEIKQVWHGGVDAATPWADFDRYGKYYYNARALDVADFPDGSGGTKTRVYVAYGLGGLMALNATDPTQLSYLGYAPAVPAHGPDDPTGQQSKSLFPYFGVGKLKESGVIDVKADVAHDRVFYGDHFAGLVILEGADDPASNWKQSGAPFDNDSHGTLGDHWPDYEFVTSYDMGAWDPEDNESLPLWMYSAPSLLVTGEISGHGNGLFLMPTIDSNTGNVDVVQATGSGGLQFIDIGNLAASNVADRFSVPAYFASTNEVGAAPDGTPTADVAIGHTQGIAATNDYLYVGDGPHGMSAWQITDGTGKPVDTPHLVANTVIDEYPVTVGGTTVYPTPHAYGVVLNDTHNRAFVLSQSLGLRRVGISGVQLGLGGVGAPLLLTPQPSDFYEHNTTSGSVGGINRQDHAYGVVFHGRYAIVADGSNGLTVYDTSMDPTASGGAHVVANLGSASGEPSLGRATGVALWIDPSNGRIYAFVAAGHAGVGVVDMTGLLRDGATPGMKLIKVFQPIKVEEEDDSSVHIGKADSRSVDVHVIGSHVYYSYGGFGLVAYNIADLIKPLPAGVDPTKSWDPHGADYRPTAVGRYVLQDEPGLENSNAEALYMTPQYFPANRLLMDGDGHLYVRDEPKLLFYVAYGEAGVAKVDWTDPAHPKLMQHRDTIGDATATAIANGRVYVADYGGGIAVFR